jgi:hypothetical protein
MAHRVHEATVPFVLLVRVVDLRMQVGKVSDGDEAGKTVYVDPATIRRNAITVDVAVYDYKSVQTVGASGFRRQERGSTAKRAVGATPFLSLEQWCIPIHKL